MFQLENGIGLAKLEQDTLDEVRAVFNLFDEDRTMDADFLYFFIFE